MQDCAASLEPVYRESRPPAPLSTFVRRVWSLDLPAGGRAERIIPDGCCEVVLTLQGEVLGGEGSSAELRPQAIVAGQMSRATLVQPIGRVRLIGIRLHPWAATEFLGCPAADFNDQVVDLRFGCPALRDRLRPPETIASVTAALQSYVATRAHPRADVARAVELIAARPRVTMRELTRRLGWSERRLQRSFAAEVGIAPKTLARIVRVQRAIELAESKPDWTWARVAASSGFADQPHLVREFQALAGCTPTALRGEPQPLRDRLLLRD